MRAWLRSNLLVIAIPVSIALVFLIPAAIALNREQFIPPPITFPDLPNPIEDPGRIGVPLPITARPQFHAGDTIVTLPMRCVNDDGGTGLGELHYTFTRALWYAEVSTPKRAMDMPGGENNAPLGCVRVRSTIHYVPKETLPGVYYIGGTVTAVGAKRSATVVWRTADFEVVAP